MPSVKTTSGETKIELDPLIIYFTFSRIRATFSCGRTITSTLDQFLRGELTVHDLPLLCVLTDGRENYFSQNNRRLYLYKELRRRGVIATIPVRLRHMPNTRRMGEKYTTEKCALQATLKREVHAALQVECDGSGEEDSDTLNCDENNDKDDEHDDDDDDDDVAQVDSVVHTAVQGTLKERKVVLQSPMDLSRSRTVCKKRKKKATEKQQVNTRASKGPIQSIEDELAELGL